MNLLAPPFFIFLLVKLGVLGEDTSVQFTNIACSKTDGAKKFRKMDTDPSKYMQCGPAGYYWIFPCTPGTKFHEEQQACVAPDDEVPLTRKDVVNGQDLVAQLSDHQQPNADGSKPWYVGGGRHITTGSPHIPYVNHAPWFTTESPPNAQTAPPRSEKNQPVKSLSDSRSQGLKFSESFGPDRKLSEQPIQGNSPVLQPGWEEFLAQMAEWEAQLEAAERNGEGGLGDYDNEEDYETNEEDYEDYSLPWSNALPPNFPNQLPQFPQAPPPQAPKPPRSEPHAVASEPLAPVRLYRDCRENASCPFGEGGIEVYCYYDGDATKYFQCGPGVDGGVWVARSCPGNLVFIGDRCDKNTAASFGHSKTSQFLNRVTVKPSTEPPLSRPPPESPPTVEYVPPQQRISFPELKSFPASPQGAEISSVPSSHFVSGPVRGIRPNFVNRQGAQQLFQVTQAPIPRAPLPNQSSFPFPNSFPPQPLRPGQQAFKTAEPESRFFGNPGQNLNAIFPHWVIGGGAPLLERQVSTPFGHNRPQQQIAPQRPRLELRIRPSPTLPNLSPSQSLGIAPRTNHGQAPQQRTNGLIYQPSGFSRFNPSASANNLPFPYYANVRLPIHLLGRMFPMRKTAPGSEKSENVRHADKADSKEEKEENIEKSDCPLLPHKAALKEGPSKDEGRSFFMCVPGAKSSDPEKGSWLKLFCPKKSKFNVERQVCE